MKSTRIQTLVAFVALAMFASVSAHAATVSVAGSIADDAGTQVADWRTATTAKTLDMDANNIYGSAGYSIFRGNAGAGGAAAWNTAITESQVAGLTLMQAGSAPLLQVGDASSAYDWDDPSTAPANRNMGYAGPRDNGGGPVALSQAFTFGVTADFSSTLRMGVAADSIGDARVLIDQLRVVVGGSQADATIVGNNNNGTADMYFFDLAGLTNGDTIEIWVANAGTSANFIWPTINGVTFDLATIPAPAALPAGLAMLGLVAMRHRRAS